MTLGDSTLGGGWHMFSMKDLNQCSQRMIGNELFAEWSSYFSFLHLCPWAFLPTYSKADHETCLGQQDHINAIQLET